MRANRCLFFAVSTLRPPLCLSFELPTSVARYGLLMMMSRFTILPRDLSLSLFLSFSLFQVMWQTGALQQLCRGYGTEVRYIKPHGALYHTILEGGEQGRAVFEAAQMLGLPLLLMPVSPWATYGEGFAERAYDGTATRHCSVLA